MPPEFSLDPEVLAAALGGGFRDYLNADARASVADNGKPSYAIDQAAWQLVRGEPGWSSALGQGFTVTYAYRASAPASMPSDTSGFQRFNAAQINQAELALKAWSDVANIHFVRVGFGTVGEAAYSDSAAILLGDYTSGESGASAFTYFPGSTAAGASAGDVWVNATLGYNLAPSVGNYGGAVLVHELGHAIGLDHPSDYNASADATLTYAADASYYEDDRQYTVMSYFSETNTGAYYAGAYPAAPMLDDIAAAQLEYGSNLSTRTGDTVYGFHSNADAPWFVASSSGSKLVFAVWDAGGNDTFDFSGYPQNQLIDLRPGFFSDVGGLTGNVAVAQNVTIENAVGGPGADTINGNDAANVVDGGFGSDTVRGLGGDDAIVGGGGNDVVNGNLGADTAHGGQGDDTLYGGQANDMVYGDDGADNINGNLGSDAVDGGPGNDTVYGGQGDDWITGGDGNDWISGDRGDDTETGGAGADTFRSFVGAGIDRILDFNAAEGDRIQLDPGTSYGVAQAGADTVIALGSGADQVILVGVQAGALPPGAILIA